MEILTVKPAAIDAPTIHANAAPALVYHAVLNSGIDGSSGEEELAANMSICLFVIVMPIKLEEKLKRRQQ